MSQEDHSRTHKWLERISAQLDALTKQLADLGTKIMASIDDIAADVTSETTVIASISTLITGLQAAVAAAVAGGITPALQAKIDAVFATAETNKAALAAAVLAGTPVQPAPVAASPQVAAAAAAKKL